MSYYLACQGGVWPGYCPLTMCDGCQRHIIWNQAPAQKAQLCPVCEGTGRVSDDASTERYAMKECYGCEGKGWVVV
jgi:DnaJ-class molecular chaperone